MEADPKVSGSDFWALQAHVDNLAGSRFRPMLPTLLTRR